ncbi:hypothetical protein [Mesorhizobium sp.]|uniref:hypothetical protein n=1 Tax=Mesorhizobium sp. TaxID=1871066 RepID=UPI000FE961F0|nr:hypothetical protein [Mesorhizobium sp.]RWN33428.1 MAG: hypothetical protein EOR95_15890 [Mesorhizobium sp.]
MTEYLLSYAVRAGISERDFWKMTASNVILAYAEKHGEQQEGMSVLAYRTAMFTRMKHSFLPKNEAELLKKPEPKKKPQTIQDQLAMAKFVTQIMSKAVH